VSYLVGVEGVLLNFSISISHHWLLQPQGVTDETGVFFGCFVSGLFCGIYQKRLALAWPEKGVYVYIRVEKINGKNFIFILFISNFFVGPVPYGPNPSIHESILSRHSFLSSALPSRKGEFRLSPTTRKGGSIYGCLFSSPFGVRLLCLFSRKLLLLFPFM
jgi:hypothetical protein